MCLSIPGQIIAIDESNPMLPLAHVDFGGVQKQVSLCFTPHAKIGEYVLVHVGFAISIINEDEVNALLNSLSQLSDPDYEIG